MQMRRLMTAALITTVATTGALVATSAPAVAAPALPPGFILTDMPSGQDPERHERLTDFAYLPDGGGVLTTGKSGTVAWVSPAGVPTTIATIPGTVFAGDLGLVGIALDRDFTTNRRIYTASARSVANKTMLRLSRWTVDVADRPIGLGDEQTIFEFPAGSNIHGMTGVLAAADGTLWVSSGDSAGFFDRHALKVMDVNEPYGKLFHINPDGTGVQSNPYYDGGSPRSWRSRVYAHGFRSPFRFSLDPASGTPIVGDVGWNVIEEIDLVRKGSYYGWPCWEADRQTSYIEMPECGGVGTANPVYSYPRSFGGSSVTGGLVYTGESYPAKYRGAYFFGDYSGGRLWSMKLNPDGTIQRAPEANGFGADIGGPVKFGTAPNGDIVYADIYTGKLRRLSYTQGNRPPVAKATATNNPTTLEVNFKATGTYDPDGDTLTYEWDFGDGSTGTGDMASHTYVSPGDTPVTVTLTVTDPFGRSATDSLIVVPNNNAPQLALKIPDAGTTYRVGDQISLSATATDVEDGALTVTWSTDKLHCVVGIGCHSHPGTGRTGADFTMDFDDHGDDTELRITASATDQRGSVTERTYVAQPRQRTLKLISNLPAAMSVDGRPVTETKLTVGAKVTITAAEKATDGVATFNAWADGATRQRQYVVPDEDVTLTAGYLTPIDLRYATDEAFRLVLGAPTGPEIEDGKIRFRVYAKGRAYWSPTTTAREVHGSILGTYLALGGHQKLGVPTTDESDTRDNAGKYNDFTGLGLPVSIYWSPGTGAQEVMGVIRVKWAQYDRELGVLGYPTTGERITPDNIGRYNHFNKGASIYWTPGTGAHEVHGDIHKKWEQLGWETGILGYPTTDESPTFNNIGRYNHFTKSASVYWSPGTGARAVNGLIRDRWAQLGWEKSYLGYPTSDEFAVPGGRRSNFQHGHIIWNAATGRVTDHRG